MWLFNASLSFFFNFSDHFMSAPAGNGDAVSSNSPFLPDSRKSIFTEEARKSKKICGFPILDIRRSEDRYKTFIDIVDEAIYHFRTNLFMRSFQLGEPAIKIIVYLTYYGAKILSEIKDAVRMKADLNSKLKEIIKKNSSTSGREFWIPGEEKFILAEFVTKDNFNEAELVGYFALLRNEMARRMFEKICGDGNEPNDFWMSISHKRFLDKELKDDRGKPSARG